MKNSTRAAVVLLSCALSTPALAHTGAAGVTGIAAGFLHPFSGIDHILAMLGVGFISVLLNRWPLYLLPAAFLSAMAIGFVLALGGLQLPLVEAMIAVSVVVTGLAIAADRTPSAIYVVLPTVFFAAYHGHAHGLEMPLEGSTIGYGAGFLIATAALHMTGVLLGLAQGRSPALRAAARSAALMVAATGFGLLVA